MTRITKSFNKYAYYILIIVSTFLFSCTEKFLETNANEITIDAISSEQAVQLVNSTYNIFLSFQSGHHTLRPAQVQFL